MQLTALPRLRVWEWLHAVSTMLAVDRAISTHRTLPPGNSAGPRAPPRESSCGHTQAHSDLSYSKVLR